MHPPGPFSQAEDGVDDLEPQVLSYVQFRNQMTLLDWQRRRAEYERASLGADMATRRVPESGLGSRP